VAYQLAHERRIWLPGINESNAISVPILKVADIGKVGPVDRDINGDTPEGGIRGPFEIVPLSSPSAPTYPILWSHEAERERRLEFEPDSEGIIRKGSSAAEDESILKKVDAIWGTASHCHFNRDFRFNSQSTAMQFSKKKSIGGRAWPSIKLMTPDQEKALVAWGNTSLGLLLHWWHSNRQQSGRGAIGVSMLQSLPILDVTALSAKQLAAAVRVFDTIKQLDLRPINEIDNDAAREKLDEEFAIDVLGMPVSMGGESGVLALLREKLANEPSISGGKGL